MEKFPLSKTLFAIKFVNEFRMIEFTIFDDENIAYKYFEEAKQQNPDFNNLNKYLTYALDPKTINAQVESTNSYNKILTATENNTRVQINILNEKPLSTW